MTGRARSIPKSWFRAAPCSTPASAARPSLARTPDRATGSRIAAYLGKSDRFEESIADFAEAYAAQNDADYQALMAAIDSGRLEAELGL